MLESANLKELGKIVRAVITPEVVSEGRPWRLNEPLRRKIRRAMLGPGDPGAGTADISVPEQKELLSQFTKRIAGPMIESLPPHAAAWAVLMLYEEFVQAVFISPTTHADVGGGD